MTSRLRFICLIRLHQALPIALVAACSGNGNFVSSADEKKDDGAGTTDSTAADGDVADTPEVVSGAYLTCTEREAVSQTDLAYGCNLAAQDATQVHLSDVARDWTWRAQAPQKTGHSVRIQENNGGRPTYHVVYYFTGKDAKAFADLTTIALELRLENSGSIVPLSSSIKEALGRTPVGRTLGSSAPGESAGNAPAPTRTPASKPPTQSETAVVEAPVGPDADGDKVPDVIDLCSKSPAGANVWRQGEWSGCSEHEYRDSDDPDLDRVPTPGDMCPDTPPASVGEVNRDKADTYYGCAPGDLYVGP